MKILSRPVVLLALLILAIPQVMAESCTGQDTTCRQDAASQQSSDHEAAPAEENPSAPERNDSAFVLFDVIVYRPLGLVATIIGSALYVGLSPLTALASIPPPHDAFARVGDILVVAPAAYTLSEAAGKKGAGLLMPLHWIPMDFG